MESGESSVNESVNNDVQSTETSTGSAAETKRKLRQQINELKSMISQIESSLGEIKFGDVTVSNGVKGSNASDVSCINEVGDVHVELENDFYRFSGIHCTKFSSKEAIFHLNPAEKYDKKNCFAIQILYQSDKATLGKWVLPMSVDIDQLLLEYSLNNVSEFVIACKHYVDSYYKRLQEYQALLSVTSELKNCILQANLGYTQITLTLMKVHFTEIDWYENLDIYFLYEEKETVPFKLLVESNVEEVSKQKISKIKCNLLGLRPFDLCSMFEKLLTKNSHIFTWRKEEDIESSVELDAQSMSDNGFIDSIECLLNKSSERQTRKKQVRRKYKKTKQQNVSNSKNSLDSNQKSLTLMENRENRSFHSKTVSSTNDSINTTAISNANNSNRVKLRQSKLNFTTDKIQESRKNKNAPPLPSVLSKKKKRKMK